jgi:hypothetical protein
MPPSARPRPATSRPMPPRPAPQAASRSGVVYPPRPDLRPGPPPGSYPAAGPAGHGPAAAPHPAASPPPPSQPAVSPPADGPEKPGTALALRSEAAAPASRTPASPAEALQEFAKDLRELRSKAGLGYPEIEELSHYTMKTLASAAGGMKLPTLPVTAAYVRACGGSVPEWEDRWHDLASLIEPAGDRPESQPERARSAPAEGTPGRPDGARAGEPGNDPRGGTPSPEAPPRTSPGPASPGAPRGPEQVYVITSAAPKRPYR